MDAKNAAQNIQDAFLNAARRDRLSVSMNLIDGSTLLGRIRSFDKYCVVFDAGNEEHLIFKHAISTISHAQRRRPTGQDAAGVNPSLKNALSEAMKPDEKKSDETAEPSTQN